MRPSGSQPRPEGCFGTSTIVSCFAVGVHRDDALVVLVGEPQPAFVPARAFGEGEAVENDCR